MRKARPLQCQDGHRGTAKAPWDLSRLAHGIARVACGLALALAAIGPAPARADGSDGCLEGAWIAEARAFVAEETGIPAPEACVRLARKEHLNEIVFPAALDESHGETVAAVYVPATREILLADDLDPAPRSRAAISSTNWCMRSSSRAARMSTSDARECWRRTPTAPKPFISAPGAYGRRPSFFRFWECSRVLAATRTDRPTRAMDWILELQC